MPSRAILASILLLATAPGATAQTPEDFARWATPLAGAYSMDGGEHVIVTPHPSLGLLSLFWLERGDVRGLERLDDGRFAFGHGLYPSEPYAGFIEFTPASGVPDGLRVRGEGEPDVRASRVPMTVEEARIARGAEATLAGLLVTPPGDGPFPAALVLPSGYGDRWQHWRLAMVLLVRGIGSLVYDARLAGASTGAELPGHYHARSLIRAEDAGAAARWLRSADRIDPAKTGVMGWSQGGWLGAIVAGRDPEVAFWVDIAGNLNPGWQQARHARLADLRYEGFSEAELDAARRYLDAYYGVMEGTTTWSRYASALAGARETSWMRWLEEEGFSVAWSSPEDAAAYARLERDNVPEDDVASVRQPALGIYFGFDESSPPESPQIFVRGLTRAGNADYLLRSIPDATHEAWIVEDWLRKEREPPTRLSRLVFRLVADWIAEVIGAPEDEVVPLRESGSS